jgi:hypothetical protein
MLGFLFRIAFPATTQQKGGIRDVAHSAFSFTSISGPAAQPVSWRAASEKLHSSSISRQTRAFSMRRRHSFAPIPIQRRIKIVDHRPRPAHAALDGQRRISNRPGRRRRGNKDPSPLLSTI